MEEAVGLEPASAKDFAEDYDAGNPIRPTAPAALVGGAGVPQAPRA